MATVTELLNRAGRITGLRTTGSERELALQALQDAYRRAIMDAETRPESVQHSFIESGDTYELDALLGMAYSKLLHVDMEGTSCHRILQQVSHQELLDTRDVDQGVGTPKMYAVVGFDRIAFHPNPAVGDAVNIWFLPDAPELVETDPQPGQETTPSLIPVQFHWSILLPGAVIEMLDNDQRLEEGSTWNSRYERGIARLQEFMGQVGGNANRAYLSKGGR